MLSLDSERACFFGAIEKMDESLEESRRRGAEREQRVPIACIPQVTLDVLWNKGEYLSRTAFASSLLPATHYEIYEVPYLILHGRCHRACRRRGGGAKREIEDADAKL